VAHCAYNSADAPFTRPGRPEVVCLCGSTRFMDTFFSEGWRLTLEGKIVLSVGVCKHAKNHGGEALGPEVARELDELHLRKIDLANRVCILNVGGYIGKSTMRELEYAARTGHRISFLEVPCKSLRNKVEEWAEEGVVLESKVKHE